MTIAPCRAPYRHARIMTPTIDEQTMRVHHREHVLEGTGWTNRPVDEAHTANLAQPPDVEFDRVHTTNRLAELMALDRNDLLQLSRIAESARRSDHGPAREFAAPRGRRRSPWKITSCVTLAVCVVLSLAALANPA